MIGQVGNWLELSFWQLAAQVMSKARPLSGRVLRAAKLFKEKPLSIEARPLRPAVRPQWMVALSGWLLGMVLGYLIAVH